MPVQFVLVRARACVHVWCRAPLLMSSSVQLDSDDLSRFGVNPIYSDSAQDEHNHLSKKEIAFWDIQHISFDFTLTNQIFLAPH
jgi:hypothetical protein